MANIVYYRGDDVIAEFGIQGESIDKTDCITLATPDMTMAYLEELTIVSDEHVTRDKFINSGNGRNMPITYKGIHEASARMTFKIAKDATQTDAMECYFLKLAIDGTSTDASNVYTIPPVANEYGSDYLKIFTLEAGYNLSGNISANQLMGCIVNQETMHIEMGQPIKWTWNLFAIKNQKITSFTTGTIGESTEHWFEYGDAKIAYGDVGATATLDGAEMFEHTINNNVTPQRDLANATSTRSPTHYTCGVRQIGGLLRLKLTTAAENGQDLWEDLFGDSSGTASPSETIINKDINIRLYIDGTYYVDYTYHNVVLPKLEEPLKGKDVGVITIPWTAEAVVLVFKANASVSEPTNWS